MKKQLLMTVLLGAFVVMLIMRGCVGFRDPGPDPEDYLTPSAPPAEVPVGEWVDLTGGPTYENGTARMDYSIGEAKAPRLTAQLKVRPKTLPLQTRLWLPPAAGGHSWQTVAEAVGVAAEQLQKANPGWTDEDIAFALREGGYFPLILDGAYPLPWDNRVQAVRLAMPLENTDKMASVSMYQDYTVEIPAGLPEDAARVLAEGMWYLEQGGNSPSEYIIGSSGDFVTIDGTRFITYEAFCTYAAQYFTPEWVEGWSYSITTADNGRLRFHRPERGGNVEYIARLYTAPVTLEDGSIEFYQLVLENEMLDWSKETVEPTHVTRSRVLLQLTEEGYRVAELEYVTG